MDEPKRIIPFKTVPVPARRDGWTVEKQYAFIEALAVTGIVEHRRARTAGATGEHGDGGSRVRARRAMNIVNFRAFATPSRMTAKGLRQFLAPEQQHAWLDGETPLPDSPIRTQSLEQPFK
jgi:hypothetical protein